MMLMLIFSIVLVENSMASTDGIIEGLEGLKKDVISLREQSNNIKASLPKLALNISEAIQMDPLVSLQRDSLKEAKTKGNLVEKCEELFNSKYHWVVVKLHAYVSNKINQELETVQSGLTYIEKNINEYVEKVKAGEISQEEIEEIIKKSEIDFDTVGRLLYVLPLLAQNTLYDLDKEPTSGVVKQNLLIPVSECLENSKITEYRKN